MSSSEEQTLNTPTLQVLCCHDNSQLNTGSDQQPIKKLKDIISYLLRDGGDVHPEPLRPFLQLINVHLRQQKQHIYLVFSIKTTEKLYF